jgi:hypothetical protein
MIKNETSKKMCNIFKMGCSYENFVSLDNGIIVRKERGVKI